ncbi:endonuclease/exonuclease/phosphatase family protein [Nocardiopsis potens]|uniref:endonuclease/exonuclease/phosphatase family protein n=1 Tax=Nocardiopsis potens TaxID=1246458 RepID=UPI000349EFA6|nr:endonuclease/exonuclease/phosphatase family protein [Nocardiopsis potens]
MSARTWRPVAGAAAAVAGAAAVLLAGHRLVPGDAGVLLESGLPWLGLAAPVAAVAAVALRSRAAAAAAVAVSAVWAALFVPAYVPGPGPEAGGARLDVATLNVGADNPRACEALREAAAWGADVVAVQELAGPRDCAAEAFGGAGEWVRQGTVGVWSRHPVAGVEALDLGVGWIRGVRLEVRAPGGEVAVVAGHAASLRPGTTGWRDDSVAVLAEAARAADGPVVVLADLNTAATDRAMGNFSGFGEAQRDAGWGPGFTWPAGVPAVRLDHVLYRSARAVSAEVRPVPGSDHRAALAELVY